MKVQFDQHVNSNPNWNVGDEVWLRSKKILTTRPSPKLDHRWLGPFPISEKISNSAYKLTLPLSMQGLHPVFHVSLLWKHHVDTIPGCQPAKLTPIRLEDGDKWEVEEILDC